MPSVDVIIPNYQYGRFLPDCIRSVLAQDVPDLRVLIIDNASTDDSVQVARAFAAADKRVQLVEHPINLGNTASFNEGIDLADADYFVMLCSDDLLVPGSLARAIAVMEQHPELSLAHGKAKILGARDLRATEVSESGPPVWTISTGTDYIERICRKPLQRSIGFMLIRTATQKRAGHYRKELTFTNDLEMLLRLAHLGGIAETNTVQGIRREHAANISSAYWDDFMRRMGAVQAAIETFLSNDGRSLAGAKRLRRLMRGSMGRHAYWSAVSHLVRGKARESLKLFRVAFSLSPRLIVAPPVAHLFQMHRVFARASEVFSEAFGIVSKAR